MTRLPIDEKSRMSDVQTTTAAPPKAAPGARRAFAILTGVATLFVFVQFATAGELIHLRGAAGDLWSAVHGLTAYGVVLPAAAAAIVAVVALRRAAPVLAAASVALVVAAIAQLGTGQAIANGEVHALVPFHVFFSAVVLALAVWASVRSAVLRRG